MTAEDQRMRREAKQGSNDLLRALVRYLQNRKNWINNV
jgi:hypothetical protein